MKPVLAIDLGKDTGWCLRKVDGTFAGGTYDFSGSSSRVGQKYHNFRRFLLRTAKIIEPDEFAAVIYEVVQFSPKRGGFKAAQSWAGFEAILTQWCEYREIRYVGVPVGTLKKSFTGTGHADKNRMLSHARSLGWLPTDHNHADAIALMQYYEVKNERRKPRRPTHEASQGQDLAL